MPEKTYPKIMVVMGPTASGKSAMAMAIAAARPAVIINADAMQMVDALRVLTARPSPEEEAKAEHALYGVLPPESPTSVAVWLQRVKPVIERVWAEGKLPLLVGGTGMYVKALMEGLAEVPPIPQEVRVRVRSYSSPLAGEVRRGGVPLALCLSESPLSQPSPARGEGFLHALLHQKDPIMAAKLKPGDTQRILRALEVIEATGISLDTWQARAAAPLFPEAEFASYYLDLPREEIYARIDLRFEAMLENGALEEVHALMARKLDPSVPILRAHGVPELMAYMNGTVSLEQAIEKGQQNTRNYAKRQMTWIRNQLPDAVPLKSGQLPELP